MARHLYANGHRFNVFGGGGIHVPRTSLACLYQHFYHADASANALTTRLLMLNRVEAATSLLEKIKKYRTSGDPGGLLVLLAGAGLAYGLVVLTAKLRSS